TSLLPLPVGEGRGEGKGPNKDPNAKPLFNAKHVPPLRGERVTCSAWRDPTGLHPGHKMSNDIFNRIAEGRTDLVFDYVTAGHAATSTDKDGVSLLQWCSYHGDVSAIKFLIANGALLQSLGRGYGLGTAAFHGHWRLCQFLIEQGADVNERTPDTGESP